MYGLFFLILLNLFLQIFLTIRFRDDIYKRLAEQRTHRELRNCKREIYQNRPAFRIRIYRHFTQGTLWAERAFLTKEMLPPVMTIIRNSIPYLNLLSLIAAILCIAYQKIALFRYVGLICIVLIWILFVVYLITDKINAISRLPKMSAKAQKIRKRNAFFMHPHHNRSYTKQEWHIIIRAYLLRFSPILACGIPGIGYGDQFFILSSGLILFAEGILTEYHRKNATEVFLCACQDISHRRMTPFEHTESFRRHAQKEGRLVVILEFCLSGILLITSLILYLY